MMYEARGNFIWQPASAILALVTNVNRKANSSPVSPEAMNPFRRRKRRRVDATMSVKDLWGVLDTMYNKDRK